MSHKSMQVKKVKKHKVLYTFKGTWKGKNSQKYLTPILNLHIQ